MLIHKLIEDVQDGSINELEEIYVSELVERYETEPSELRGVIAAYVESGVTVKERVDKGKQEPRDVEQVLEIIKNQTKNSEETLYVKYWHKGEIRRIYINSYKGYCVGYIQSYAGGIWDINHKNTFSDRFWEAVSSLKELNEHVPNIKIKIHNQ